MKIKRLLASLILSLGMTLAFLWLLTAGSMTLVHADTYTVTSTNPSGPGSLRQAILDANSNPGPDAITFSPGVSGAIVLTDALPAIGDDLTITGPGAEQLDISGANTYRVFSITTGIAVTITKVTVRDGNVVNSDGGGIWSAGDLYLSAAHILSNSAYSGGGVYVYQGSATLSGTQVVSNSADWDGGGVYVSQGNAMLNVSGGMIDSNSAYYGGGVYVKKGSVMLSGTQVIGNLAGLGGGVCVNSDSATLNVNGGVINSNLAMEGGGVRVCYGSAMLSGTQVVGNSASNDGGGVFVWYGRATLSETQVTGNSAYWGGGGVSVIGGSVTLSGGRITSNFASDNGGGVYVRDGSVTLSGGRITSNFASDDGGGVYVRSGRATLIGMQVDSNSANLGGGVYVRQGSATLSGTYMVSNSATYDGGGVYVYWGGATLNVSRGGINGNLASSGGGVYVNQGSAMLDGTQIIANDALTGSALHTGGMIIPMTALTITGDIYQEGGCFAGSSHDLRVEGSLNLAGGHFYAPTNLELGGPFTHTGGTFHQTQVVTGSSDVGFPKAGGVILNANGQGLGSTEVALTAGDNCAGVTVGKAVAHCYIITPTIVTGTSVTGRDAVVTFYYNNSEVPVGQSCVAMEAFRWDSTWNNLLTRDSSYGTEGRMCGGDPLSVKVTDVMTFSLFVLRGVDPDLTVYLPLVLRNN